MDEKRFDDVLSGLPRSFNDPPAPPLDEMWAVIEDKHFNAAVSTPRWSRSRSFVPWLAAAATLVIGIGIGRSLAVDDSTPEPTPQTIAGSQVAPAGIQSEVVDAYRDETTQYLGQAAALLISLPEAGAPDLSDARFAGKASDLLVTTRLLMDSPAAQDPKLRGLLEDLELVLVQIARLRVERNKSDLDLIHQTVEQGDVMSRLNSAVVTNQSGE
jgi:hypothetical protein